jgi:5-methyltetrahydropteroyltriglutamate--homocysteine methyltransferase
MTAFAASAPPKTVSLPIFRADHIGSFLRPRSLLDAREKFRRGELSAAEFRSVEDQAISEVVRLQESAGLDCITDGEFRREYFHLDFLSQLGGVQTSLPVIEMGADGKQHLTPPTIRVIDKVRHVKDIQLADFLYLQSVTNRTPKVTIPSPTMLHFRGGRDAINRQAYPDLEEFYQDVADAYAAELRSLASAGCRVVQLDDTNLAYLCDPKMRHGALQRGDDPSLLPHRYAGFLNRLLDQKPPGMSVGVHLCRGNFKSTWAAEGGYEPVAEALFAEMNFDTYFLEYDDERSGGFLPLRYLPKGKTAVLGLITTKLGALENKADVKRRVHEAACHAPLEQLALSPQCGFASTLHGNDIAADAQLKKLRLVVELAGEIWQ